MCIEKITVQMANCVHWKRSANDSASGFYLTMSIYMTLQIFCVSHMDYWKSVSTQCFSTLWISTVQHLRRLSYQS